MQSRSTSQSDFNVSLWRMKKRRRKKKERKKKKEEENKREREKEEVDGKERRGERGRKYSNDDDYDDVLRAAVMAPFYHDYRAAILHATRCRYSSLQLPRPPLPPPPSPSPTLPPLPPLPAFSPSPSKLPFRRAPAILPTTITNPGLRRALPLRPAASVSGPFIPALPLDTRRSFCLVGLAASAAR